MIDIVQGSPEWHQARCGFVTASRVSDIIAKTKSGPSASRANYLAQIVAERLTGNVAESYSTPAMQWGAETEAEARAAYEFYQDATVSTVGFWPHETIPMTGASPDGLVGNDGLLEIKCPNTATHLETLLKRKIPDRYHTQMQWQMACTCRLWCDFASYDPRMPEHLRLFVQRVERDDARIAELETEVKAFLADVEKTIQALGLLYRNPELEAA